MALVGRMHACRARPMVPEAVVVNTPKVVVNKTEVVVNTAPKVVVNNRSADRHANPEKRRAYMRTYMAKRRAPRPDRLNS